MVLSHACTDCADQICNGLNVAHQNLGCHRVTLFVRVKDQRGIARDLGFSAAVEIGKCVKYMALAARIRHHIT